ncbi:MAG TPA: beta-ketoacyl-ACP synthase 3 [Candidatus Dormibacteraeota bacterium]|nr:beta-ketoacyl-ACP synthase 3 [Candidatus Dormibacteraeota bacterium]
MLAVGAAVPVPVVTNDQLSRFLDTSDDWVRSRTGIRERRVAPPEQSLLDLAARAARAALAAADLPATAIDTIICTSSSIDTTFPALACRLQAALGCPLGPAFDLQAACTGTVYAAGVARALIQTGAARRVLVVGAEIFSRVVDWHDRGTAVIFGDGAGAMILGTDADPGSDIVAVRLGADGRGADALWAADYAVVAIEPDAPAPAMAEPPRALGRVVRMNGREVFRFSTQVLERLVLDLAADGGLRPADLALVVPHQANSRILATAATRLGLPPERMAQNLDHFGNTSSASVPLALVEAVQHGRCQPGDMICLAAFGAGLTWGGLLLRWGPSAVALDDPRQHETAARLAQVDLEAAQPIGTGRER